MGCKGSHTDPNSIIKIKNYEPKNLVDSNDKFLFNRGSFVFYKTLEIREEYELGPVLGSGAYGSVRTAVHKLTGQERAIKTVNKQKVTKSIQTKTKFFSEIEILTKVDHPNILRVYEFYEDTKNYHLVTEILRGGNLFDFIISSNIINEAIAANFMKQILGAVNYCHKLGIVHRDLKPENILLESKNPAASIKVIDFGSSTLVNDSKTIRGCFGTCSYIAPEVLTGKYTEKCDIWSCGVIMYILLCGKSPFPGNNDEVILKKIKKGEYKLGKEWDMISNSAKDLVRRMLEYDFNLRISAHEAFNHEWFTEKINLNASVDLKIVIQEMKGFRATKRLQSAVLSFITSQLSSKEETKILSNSFKMIDKDGDGRISKQELIDEFIKTMAREEAEAEAERIIKEIDTDGNGFIDYSEFLTASLKKETLISKKNLEGAFRIFDNDSSGTITAEELKRILGPNLNDLDDVWNQLIQTVDQNGDGEIDLKEFKDMMLNLFDNN
jgi:calcium-dependent protein kinase